MRRAGVFLIGLIFSFFFSRTVHAVIDPPHTAASSVLCDDCHGDIINSPFFTDNTLVSAWNSICERCHGILESLPPYDGPNAPPAVSHAPGGATIKCVVCHDNHEQEQIYTGMGAANQSTFFLATGTASNISYDGATDLTRFSYSNLQTKGSWTPAALAAKSGDGRGTLLMPNRNNRRRSQLFMVESIDDPDPSTIIVKGDASSLVSDFALIYGQVIRSEINFDAAPPIPGMPVKVRFYDSSGANAFVGNSAPYGICQVCHTQTDHWRSDGTLAGVGVHAGMDSDTVCSDCHNHSKGFKASCESCHGYAPVTTATLVWNPPEGTGSQTAGAHTQHTVRTERAEYDCEACHYNSVGTAPDHNDKSITIGFSPPGGIPMGGSYDGQAGVTYANTETSPGTSVSSIGTKTCADLYCHSTGQGIVDPSDPPEYATPTWDAPATGKCGSCHGLGSHNHTDRDVFPAMNTGSHQKHLESGPWYWFNGSGSNCQVCHWDQVIFTNGDTTSGCLFCHLDYPNWADLSSRATAKHVDGFIDVDLHDRWTGETAIYTGDNIPGTAYGSCENVYCHGNYPGSGLNATPAWGDAPSGACGTCHGASNSAPPASGTHVTHAHSSVFNYPCYTCHMDIVAGTGPASYTIIVSPIQNYTKHVDGLVDWKFDDGDPKLQGGSESYSIATDTRAPSDGTVRAYGSCDNIYCHSNAQPDGGIGAPDEYVQTPVWNNKEAIACNSCHKGGAHDTPLASAMSSGSHSIHIDYFNYPFPAAASCQLCHYLDTYPAGSECDSCHLKGLGLDTGENIRIEKHVDGAVDIDFMTSFVGSDGSYSGSPEPGDVYGACQNTYCHGDFPGSGLNAEPEWGNASTGACWTCHGYNSGTHGYHISYNLACETCHDNVVSGSSSISNKATHVSGFVDWTFNAADARLQGGSETYSITSGTKAPTDGTSRSYGNCNNIYCHSNAQPDGGSGPPDSYATPTWGGSSTCGSCHKGGIHDEAGPPLMDSGSHTAHLQYNFNAAGVAKCAICHTMDGDASGSPGCINCHVVHLPAGDLLAGVHDVHVDGNVTMVFDAAYGTAISYSGTPEPGDGYGTCENTYCHSDGKSVGNAYMYPIESYTTNWDGVDPDPQGDGNACNNCHEYPPTKDSHSFHAVRGYTCSNCHGTVVDSATENTIIDKSKHVNGEFDVSPSGQFWHGPSGQYWDIDFTYTPQPISGSWGGECSSNTCHQRWGFTDPKKWLYTTINSSFGYTESCSGESTVNATVTSSGGTAPYECNFDWGDGNSDSWGSCVASHDYGVRDTFTITWQARDSEGIPMIDPNPGMETINVCNSPPVPDFDLVQGGGAGYDVILYDRSTDPDFDTPGHSGTGEIKVVWEGWNCGAPAKAISSAEVDISDVDPGSPPPFERRHYFRYSTGNSYNIYIAVKDNGGDWVCSNRKQYLVQSSSVSLNSILSPPTEAQCNAVADNPVTYPSFQFNNDGAAENWTAVTHLAALTVGSGVLSTTTSGIDPIMRNTCVVLNGSHVSAFYVRMKTTCGTTGQIYWTTGADGTETEAKSQSFSLTSDGTFQDYIVDLSGNAEWTGKDIRTLRFDPTNPPDATPCTIEIDYIQAHSP